MARFEKNVEAAIPALRRYARALTRDSEVADDLVENALLQALRSKHLFNGGVVRDRLYSILIELNGDRLRALAWRPTPAPRDGVGAKLPASKKYHRVRIRRWWSIQESLSPRSLCPN